MSRDESFIYKFSPSWVGFGLVWLAIGASPRRLVETGVSVSRSPCFGITFPLIAVGLDCVFGGDRIQNVQLTLKAAFRLALSEEL